MLEKEQKLQTNKQTNFNLKVFLKLSISSIVLSSGLYAADIIQPVDFTKYPLPKELTAQSRGGNLPDKTAATDGIGSLLVKPVGKNTDKLKNDAYNKIIYGNIKKLEDNENINDLITNGKITIDSDILNKINDNTVDNNGICEFGSYDAETGYCNMTLLEFNNLDFLNKYFVVNNDPTNLQLDTFTISDNSLSMIHKKLTSTGWNDNYSKYIEFYIKDYDFDYEVNISNLKYLSDTSSTDGFYNRLLVQVGTINNYNYHVFAVSNKLTYKTFWGYNYDSYIPLNSNVTIRFKHENGYIYIYINGSLKYTSETILERGVPIRAVIGFVFYHQNAGMEVKVNWIKFNKSSIIYQPNN